ncbi:hypothetical protein ATO10_08768 [Actibacterium atlanticum]|uniref:DUF2059 domain-containing protein n=1 Tax=Actibacterium atlanticum TaxID=1461693 RepID=A0A058ZL24_9RHOB|nr:DUF2059 domain-containing protein [Actibacterium atlanticum]KCV81925.1 hypothetical protein ATO10_08768 [Actibacterium atlanticum]
MKRLCTFALLVATALPATATPQDDARYIVEQTVTEQLFEAAILAQQTYISAAISHQLAQQGIEVSDMPAFMGIIVDEMLASFTAGMKAEMETFYVENFTDKELADLAKFYATPTGQALMAKQPELISHSTAAGAQVGRDVQQGLLPAVAARVNADGIEIGEPGMTERFLELFQ